MSETVSLVTGGAGFMGSHVARQCLNLGHRVVVLDDLSGGFDENVPAGAGFIHGSVCDETLIRTLFDTYHFRYVYHLAAYAAEGLSHFIRCYNYNNNLIGSMNLLNAAVRSGTVERFVFSSSIAVYGKNQLPMTEEMTPVPEDPYGISKIAVELDLRAAHEMFGLNYTIFRPHNVYGEGQNIGDPYRNVVGIFMNQIMSGSPMTIFGDGRQTRAFSYIDDVSPLIAGCVDVPASGNEVFNVGADEACSVLELAQLIAGAFAVEPSIEFLPVRKEVIHAFASHEKLALVFGKRESVSLSEGIRRMAEWARLKGSRQSPPFAKIEIEKNLPPSWARLKETL